MVNCNSDFVYKFGSSWTLFEYSFVLCLALAICSVSYTLFIPYMCLYMYCCVYYCAPCRAYIDELLTIGADAGGSKCVRALTLSASNRCKLTTILY